MTVSTTNTPSFGVITVAGIIRTVELCENWYGHIPGGHVSEHQPESALCPQGGEAGQGRGVQKRCLLLQP